jgi:hypothetical protein
MNLWKISTFAFASLFAATVAFNGVPAASAEAQPLMKSALGELNKAAKHLKKGTADKGGHRVKALELTRSAIAEVEAGIEYDNTH